MRADAPSATARLIAAATIAAAERHDGHELVSPEAVQWSRQLLRSSARDRVLAWSVASKGVREAWRAIESLVQPGIVRHWMLRKLWIERQARSAIAEGYARLIVLGAGLDTLGLRLATEGLACEVVEIDHPATQKLKRRVVDVLDGKKPVLIAADLLHDLPRWETLGFGPSADRAGGTIVIAEGLFMYLPPARVEQVLQWAAQAPSGRAKLIFTFMAARNGCPIGFEPRSRLVEWWLALRKERFLWAIRPEEVARFIGRFGWRAASHADAETLADMQRSSQVVARGEEVVEAERCL